MGNMPYGPEGPQRPDQKPPENLGQRESTGAAFNLAHQDSGTAAAARGAVARLERLRIKKRRRRIRILIVCILLAAGILAYFTGLYGASLALLGDAVDSVSIALTPGKSFPVPFSLSGFRSAMPLAGGFAALGNKDFVIYSSDGNEVRKIQHGYERPSACAGRTRVCIYNRSGYDLRVESRSRTLFEYKFEDPVQLCSMSRNGTLAVFTRSKLYVFDPMFENIYNFKTQDLPSAMCFSEDNRHLAVACPAVSDGILGSVIYLMDTHRDAYLTINGTEGMPVKLQYLDDERILVLFDTHAAVYSAADGSQLHRFSYEGRTLQSTAISAGKNAVLLFGDGAHSALTQITVLDDTLTEIGSAAVGAKAAGVAASREAVFVLTDKSVLCYSLDGSLLGEISTREKPLALVEGKTLILIGQNTVDKFEIPEQEYVSE